MLFLFFSLFVLMVTSPLNAAFFELSWTNSDYFYKDRLDSVRQITRVYEHLDASCEGLAGGAISLHSSFQATNDPGAAGLRKTDLLQGYMRFSGFTERADIRLGRMAIYDSPFPLYLDGVWGELRAGKFLTFSAAGGISTPSKHDRIMFQQLESHSQMVILGSLKFIPTQSTILKLQYLQNNDSGFVTGKNVSATVLQLVGNGSWVNADVVFDFENASISNISLSGQICGQVHWLSIFPSFGMDNFWYDTSLSLAKIIAERHYDPQVGFELQIGNSLVVNAGYTIFIFENRKPIHEIEGMLEHDWFSFGLKHEIEQRGVSDAVLASVTFIKLKRIRWAVFGDFTTWSNQESGPFSENWWSGGVSLLAKPLQFFDTQLDLQAIGNRLYKLDLRAYLKTRIHFSKFVP